MKNNNKGGQELEEIVFINEKEKTMSRILKIQEENSRKIHIETKHNLNKSTIQKKK